MAKDLNFNAKAAMAGTVRPIKKQCRAMMLGQVLFLADAYAQFTKLVKERNLDVIKCSDFKGLVVPLIEEQFGVRLRNDLVVDERGGVRGWKNVRLQTLPT